VVGLWFVVYRGLLGVCSFVARYVSYVLYMLSFFFFNATAPPELYTLSLHDALPISSRSAARASNSRVNARRIFPSSIPNRRKDPDRKSTRLNSSHRTISYAVFCLKKKKQNNTTHTLLLPPIHTDPQPPAHSRLTRNH